MNERPRRTELRGRNSFSLMRSVLPQGFTVMTTFPMHISAGDSCSITYDKTNSRHEFIAQSTMCFRNWDDVYTAIDEGKLKSQKGLVDLYNAVEVENAHMFPVSMKAGDSMSIIGLGIPEFTVAKARTFTGIRDVINFLKTAQGIPAIGMWEEDNV
jgi:hypothetical protein